MKKGIILLLTLSSLACKAQEHPLGIIYRAEISSGDNTRYILFNHSGQRIIPDTVDHAWSNTWDWIFVKDSKTGLAKAYNYFGTDLQIDSIEENLMVTPDARLLGIKKNGKWGYYGPDGSLKIPHLYNDAGPFDENRAVVRRGKKLFYIDTNGIETPKTATGSGDYSFEYSDIALGMGTFENADYIIYGSKLKGLKHSSGKVLTLPLYEEFYSLKEKFSCVTVKKGGRYGVVGFGNIPVIPIRYNSIVVLNDYLF